MRSQNLANAGLQKVYIGNKNKVPEKQAPNSSKAKLTVKYYYLTIGCLVGSPIVRKTGMLASVAT